MTVHIAGSRGVLGWLGGVGGGRVGMGGIWTGKVRGVGRVGGLVSRREGRKDGERERLGLGNVWKKGSRIEG